MARQVVWIALLVIALFGFFAILLRFFHSPTTTAADVRGEGCLVLAYHRVIPRPFLLVGLLEGQDDFTLYAEDFQQQLATLKSKGAKFIRPQELESIMKRTRKAPDRCVLVTLDDGDVSQYEYAFPVLEKEQIPFLIFVISGAIGGRNFNGLQMANWQQIREMASSGLATVGSHTDDMHRLDGSRQPVFMNAVSTGHFREDLQSSIATIQRETGATVQYFAYPFGFGTPQTDEVALRAGMRLLFSLREGLVRPGDPAFFVRRLMVTARNWRRIEEWLENSKPM